MGTQFTIDELANSLVSPAYFSSEEEEDMDVDILSVSAQGTERHSDDSDIEVIACYRHVPIAPTKQNATRKMTTDLSSCVDDGLPEFPWDDFSDFWPEDFQTAIVELGTGPDAIGRENNCPINQCSKLVPQVDTPLSPPLCEQGPSYSRYDYVGPNVTDFTVPVNSHIQGISVRIGANCGEPNAAAYGDCIVCGKSYEQIRETAVLTYLESTSRRGETHYDQQRRRDAYLAGMNQGTVLLVPRGVSLAAACDGNYYQIPQEYIESNPPPGVLPI